MTGAKKSMPVCIMETAASHVHKSKRKDPAVLCVHACVPFTSRQGSIQKASYLYVTRFARRSLKYTHHSKAQILPPLNSYTNEEAMHVCMIANSSSVCFSRGCFLGLVRHPQVLGLSLIGSAGC